MIKNEKQYKITKAQASNFLNAIEDLKYSDNSNIHPLILKAQKDALMSQYDELIKEIEVYDALKAGEFKSFSIESFSELPKGLIQARIAKGMTHRDLAEKLGLKEQQIQKYEATEYASASFDRINQIIEALGINVREDIFLSKSSYSQSTFFRKLASIGISKEFISKRLIPKYLSSKFDNLNELNEEESLGILSTVGSIVSKVFKIEFDSLFTSNDLQLNMQEAGAVRYKRSISQNMSKTSAFTMYANILALNLLEATKKLERKEVPDSPEEILNGILKDNNEITFEKVLKYVWELGIPVLTLKESGGFHGACWRVNYRNVIVLKQNTKSEARWIFDLLHELRHAGQDKELKSFEVIEEGEIELNKSSAYEIDANLFAGEVVLDGRAHALAKKCILRSRGLQNLKSKVIEVAKEENVRVDFLANYLAYRLSIEQDAKWWGVAQSLQTSDFDPNETSKKLLLENTDFSVLNEFDRDLLLHTLDY